MGTSTSPVVGSVSSPDILQITDTHLFASAGETLASVDTRASLGAVLDMALAQHTPKLILVTGDIAQDPHADSYAALLSLVRSRYSGDLLCLPGNHDEPDLAPELFHAKSHRFANWELLALDSHVQGEERGELAEEELSRLKEQLATSQATHILAAVHHPPLELASPLDHGRIGNGRELLELLAADGRVRGILFGHVHQAVNLEIGDLKLYGSPSTCVQFKPLVRQFALDSRPPGCRWVSLSPDGTLVTQVSRLDDGLFPAALG